MKLELGKRYRTQDGRETSPLKESINPVYPFEAEVDGSPYTWTKYGLFDEYSPQSGPDLVEEIEEEEEPNENLKEAAKRYKESEQDLKANNDAFTYAWNESKYTKTEEADGTIILKPKTRKIWIEVYEYNGEIRPIAHTTKDGLDESLKSGRERGETLLEVIEREYPINNP